MTPAELRCTIERLGLSVEWVANLAGVKSRRSVLYWMSGKKHPTRGMASVPTDLALRLEELDDLSWATAELGVEAARDARKIHGDPAQIVLLRYHSTADLWAAHPDLAERSLPVTYHAVMLSRAQWLLKKAGFKAIINYATPSDEAGSLNQEG